MILKENAFSNEVEILCYEVSMISFHNFLFFTLFEAYLSILTRLHFFSTINISPENVLAHTTYKHEYAEAERDAYFYIMSPPHKLFYDNSVSIYFGNSSRNLLKLSVIRFNVINHLNHQYQTVTIILDLRIKNGKRVVFTIIFSFQRKIYRHTFGMWGFYVQKKQAAMMIDGCF